MSKRFLRLTVVGSALFAAFSAAIPAFAANAQQGHDGPDTLVPVVIWSLVGVCIAGLVFGVLYLFKKQMGGFPQPPSWNPPIDLMLSKDLPQDPPEELHGSSDETHAAPAH